MLSTDVAFLTEKMPQGCYVCGGTTFYFREVLWSGLINEWQLSPEEAKYINIQQGFSCSACGNNLRAMTLARAICQSQSYQGTLQSWIESCAASDFNVLEINEAGVLTKPLSALAGHRLVSYPESDIHALSLPDCSVDLVIHSDTLEHVSNPVHALVECRRVLRPGGVLAFTVPLIIGRLSRSRGGLAPSYHGAPQTGQSDYAVETEFGADSWRIIVEAGFQCVSIHTDIFPASIAFTARK